jgi:hypothetical protein
MNPSPQQRSDQLTFSERIIIVAAMQGFPGRRRRTTTLGTKLLTATARSMDEALSLWRVYHGINDEAYNQLRLILVTFRLPGEIAHLTDGSYADSLLTESVFNSSPFETGVITDSFLTHGDASSIPTSRFDFLGPSSSESPQYGNPRTSSNEPYTGTAEIVQSTSIITTQPAQQSPSQSRSEARNGQACIRCWKKKLGVLLVSSLKRTPVDQCAV